MVLVLVRLDIYSCKMDDTTGKRERKGCSHYFRKCLRLACSHIGLCGMVVAYSIAGGFIFQILESPNEKQECITAQQRYSVLENATIRELLNLGIFSSLGNSPTLENSSSLGKSSNLGNASSLGNASTNFTPDGDIEDTLVELHRSVLAAFRDDVIHVSYDGKNCSQMDETGGTGHQWSFPGSLLFSVTVITTVGKS